MTGIVAVYNVKGGVGKSTLAVNLAYCAAAHSARRTLLWDIDAQGAATFLLDPGQAPADAAARVFSREIDPAEAVVPTRWPKLDLLAADLSLRQLDRNLANADKPKRLRKLLQTLAPSYDRIVLDCPPGLGEISDQLFRAADVIVVPVVPTPLSLRAFEQLREHLRHHERKPHLRPVVSMADRRKSLHREFLADHPDWPVVPQASVVERMAVERSPVVAFAGKSPAAKAISLLWADIERTLIARPSAAEKPENKRSTRPRVAKA